MKIKLFLVALLFSSSLSAVTLIGVQDPMYWFDVGPEIFICERSTTPLRCEGKHKETGKVTIYACVEVSRYDGYFKDCKKVTEL